MKGGMTVETEEVVEVGTDWTIEEEAALLLGVDDVSCGESRIEMLN